MKVIETMYEEIIQLLFVNKTHKDSINNLILQKQKSHNNGYKVEILI